MAKVDLLLGLQWGDEVKVRSSMLSHLIMTL